LPGLQSRSDKVDPKLGIGWSVVVRGLAEEVTGNLGRTAEHIRKTLVHPVAPGERWHWLAMRSAEVTGRRFQVRAGPQRRAHDWRPPSRRLQASLGPSNAATPFACAVKSGADRTDGRLLIAAWSCVQAAIRLCPNQCRHG
jgi:hypothetical protein